MMAHVDPSRERRSWLGCLLALDGAGLVGTIIAYLFCGERSGRYYLLGIAALLGIGLLVMIFKDWNGVDARQGQSSGDP